MQIQVSYLENLRIQANFDDFNVISDQPIRYKGDGTAPGPFDYFLASSAMCAAYFVKVYCNAREIPTDDIRISQDNIVDPENRYKQTFDIKVELPESISEKDREGIVRSIERCSVKRVIQNSPEFRITPVTTLASDTALNYDQKDPGQSQTLIPGKDSPLEITLKTMSELISSLGIKIEIASWRNPLPHVWSVHIRDADSPMNYTNGKGSSKDAALCSALGEFIERISNNYFYNDYYLGEEIAQAKFVHYPEEKWFPLDSDNQEIFPKGLMDDYLFDVYGQDGELKPYHLYDTNSGNTERGICALPYKRFSDGEDVYIPVNLIGNLYVSNGMSAGNTLYEARVQCLSEIFERAVKNQIISEEITLPDIPRCVLEKYPNILEGINKLEAQGFPVFAKDASLGGRFPVICVTIQNPKTGGAFASFGAHPIFEVALERSLTELLQGRSFEGLNDLPAPTFNSFAVREHNNIVDHFIDSSGVISWKFFSNRPDYEFVEWNFSGTTEEEFDYLMGILKQLEKEVYIADYECLGAKACRILVPDYSEIYLKEDLIWDNNNQALLYRNDILNIHKLEDEQVADLIAKLEDSELDNYMPISELIGVAFDENSTWGQLVIGELKGFCHLALGDLESAKEYFQMLTTFSDHLPDRKRYFQTLNTVLDLATESVEQDQTINEYKDSLISMYGQEKVERAVDAVIKGNAFTDFCVTNNNLEGIEKHERLIESYKKLQAAREKLSRHL